MNSKCGELEHTQLDGNHDFLYRQTTTDPSYNTTANYLRSYKKNLPIDIIMTVGSVLLIVLVLCLFYFLFACLSWSWVLCTQCCQFLWIVRSWFALQFSLTFTYQHQLTCWYNSCDSRWTRLLILIITTIIVSITQLFSFNTN
jgi:hypothetical protein